MNWIMVVALGAVFAVLLMGLFNMMKGGSGNRSQYLMRWRVGLQFAAIILVVLLAWMRR
jgi:tetrahydromethanopterin S-methyltransferase subunit F